jgi:hypothetical protein
VFAEQIDRLARDMEAAGIRQSLDISPRERTSRPLLLSLDGDESDICLFVHHLDNNAFFMTESHSIDFFRRVFDALHKNRIREVRRLFVSYDVARERADPATQRILEFHQNIDRFEWRAVSLALYSELATDASLYEGRLDFGVYGDRYVYVSNQRPRGPGQAIGTFIAARPEIKRYAEFFDTAWKNADINSGKIGGTGGCSSLEELFRLDPDAVHAPPVMDTVAARD